MEVKNITKGVARMHQITSGDIEISIGEWLRALTVKFINPRLKFEDKSQREECLANAELIVEAFNVANTTNLSPLQLQQRGDELYEVVQQFKSYLDSMNGQFEEAEGYLSFITEQALSKHKTTSQ